MEGNSFKYNNFDKNITFINGDFLDANLKSNSFDIVVGKAFVHHLKV